MPAAANAASVTVTTTSDGDHGSCTQATCTLRDAIKYSTADTVVLPAKAAHYGVSTTPIQVNRGVTIQGVGAAKSIITASSSGQHRLFELNAFTNAEFATVAFRGVTIENAFSNQPPGGAAILVLAGGPNLTLTGSVLRNDRSAYTVGALANDNGGGAIHNAGSSITTLHATRVTGNVLHLTIGKQDCCNGGGGLYVEAGRLVVDGGSQIDGNKVTVTSAATPDGIDNGGGGIFSKSPLGTTISNSTVRNNGVTVNGDGCCAGGGGLYVDSKTNGTPTKLTNVAVTGNSLTVAGTSAGGGSAGGGGIYTQDGIKITGGIVSGNRASIAQGSCCDGGGGVYLDSGSGPSSFTRVAVSGNTTTVDSDGCCNGGGGIAVDTGGAPFSMAQSLLSGNRAELTGGTTFSGGGGVYDDTGSDHADEYVNTTIAGNTTDAAGAGQGGGGAVFLTSPMTSPRLSNVTLAGNSAPSGVGGDVIALSTDVSVRNSIVAQGSASSGRNCAVATFDNPGSPPGSFVSGGHNLEDAPGSCGFAGSGDRTVAKTALKLAPLRPNGGPTATRAVLAGSPAVNGGNPAGCLDAAEKVLRRDQRGFLRPFGPRCDIGAFELAPPRLGRLSVKPVPFRAPPGATVSYSDTVPATTTLTLRRCSKKHPKRCRTTAGSLVHHDAVGRNSVHLSKVAGAKLAAGRYRLTARARAFGLRGKPRRAAFRVLK